MRFCVLALDITLSYEWQIFKHKRHRRFDCL